MGGVYRGLGIIQSGGDGRVMLMIFSGDHGHIFLFVKSRPSLTLPGGPAPAILSRSMENS